MNGDKTPSSFPKIYDYFAYLTISFHLNFNAVQSSFSFIYYKNYQNIIAWTLTFSSRIKSKLFNLLNSKSSLIWIKFSLKFSAHLMIDLINVLTKFKASSILSLLVFTSHLVWKTKSQILQRSFWCFQQKCVASLLHALLLQWILNTMSSSN